MQKNQQQGSAPFIEIGKGTFGIIFEESMHSDSATPGRVFKRTLQPNIDNRDWLQQDAYWHERIHKEFTKLSTSEDFILPRVPEYHGILSKDDSWWQKASGTRWYDASGGRLERYEQPSPLLSAQQIPPISQQISSSMLCAFHPDLAREEVEDTVVADNNRNALLRIYFGKYFDAASRGDSKVARGLTSQVLCNQRDGLGSSTAPRLLAKVRPSTRDFPLSQARLEAVLSRDDRLRVTNTLASALAVLHWQLQCNARDVEFVFGGVNSGEENQYISVLDQPCQVWLLDFNQVRSISLDEEGVQEAVRGFTENDPYYPKPGSKDWSTFKQEYLRVSRIVLSSEERSITRLPEMVMTAIETHQGLNRAQQLFSVNLSWSDYARHALRRVLGYS